MGTFKFTLRKVVFCVQKREDSTNKRKVEEHVTLHAPINGNESKNRRKFVIMWRIKGQINGIITLFFGPLVFSLHFGLLVQTAGFKNKQSRLKSMHYFLWGLERKRGDLQTYCINYGVEKH